MQFASLPEVRRAEGESAGTVVVVSKRSLFPLVAALFALLGVLALQIRGDEAEVRNVAADVIAVEEVDTSALPSEECIYDLMCLRQYYQAITWQLGPADALSVLKAHAQRNQRLDESCHDTTHAIGEVAALMQPISEAMFLGDTTCGSGFYHGVIATTTVQVDPENLNAVLTSGCASGEQGFHRWECFHGVGHGFVFAANGDIYAGIERCSAIANDSDRGACASGAYMQELADHGTDPKYSDDPYIVCREVGEFVMRGQCYDMLANVIMIHRDTAATQWAVCDTVDDEHRGDCYRGLGRARFAGMPFLGPEIEAFCAEAGAGRDACYEGAFVNTAAYYGSSEEAKTHCVELSSEALVRFCRDTLDKNQI